MVPSNQLRVHSDGIERARGAFIREPGITYYYCKAKWKYKETKTEDMQKKVGGAKNAKLRVRIMKTEGA